MLLCFYLPFIFHFFMNVCIYILDLDSGGSPCILCNWLQAYNRSLKRSRKFQPEDRLFSLSSVTSPAVCVISLKCLVMAALPNFFNFLSLNNIFLYVLIKEFPGMLNVYAKKKRKGKKWKPRQTENSHL